MTSGIQTSKSGAKQAHMVGLGRSGLAAIDLLVQNGWQVIVSDDNDSDELRNLTATLKERGVITFLNGHDEALRTPVDLIVVSPGVPWNAGVLNLRRLQNVEVIGEVELGARHCRGRVAAVTGSNGKTTTTKLLGDLFAASGRPYRTCGNIGLPFTAVVSDTAEETLISLEVSSFQLEGIVDFHPEVAIIMNLTPDHLDRHGSLEGYANAKSRLWRNQSAADWLIYFHDDPIVDDMVRDAPSRLFPFSVKDQLEPGACLVDGNMVVTTPQGDSISIKRDTLALPGVHNTANALAAISAAKLMGIENKVIRSAIENFKGVPHRLEFIRELDGVRWINDSKATNVDAGHWAIEAIDDPIILIAGGRTKGGGFESLHNGIREKVRLLILIGEAAEAIESDLGEYTKVVRANDMSTAVSEARKNASAGDSVLLAPLCASFDQFKNFEDRGDHFRKLVMGLK